MSLIIQRTPKTGQGYIEPHLAVGEALPLHMVLVPGGSFMMGSAHDELEHEDEAPQHEVTMIQFVMGRYPITQAQWRAVATFPQIERKLEPDPSHFKGNNRPVEQVSWDDAIEFCARLAKRTHRPYRLPSEAEWEYACRAGTTTPFYFGKTITDELANYNASETYADGPEGKYREETTPVDHFGFANAFGLSDMHGNVWEWCADSWHNNYKSALIDGRTLTEGGDDSQRALRGGSLNFIPWNCRSASRHFLPREYCDLDLGFRVCCAAPGTP